MTFKVFSILRAEVRLPSAITDDLLDKLQVPEEEMLGGEFVAGGGGEGGHGGVLVVGSGRVGVAGIL